MNVLIDIRTEIELIRKYDQYSIEVIKGKEKLSMNSYKKGLYIDLDSFAYALGITINQLLEVISYSATQRGYLAFYRNEYKIIRVLDISGLNELIRNLMGGGYDIELLKTIRDQIYKSIEQMEKEWLNMEKTKNTSVYLESVHIKYLALMSVLSGLNKSELIREMLDRDMAENADICKEYEKILY